MHLGEGLHLQVRELSGAPLKRSTFRSWSGASISARALCALVPALIAHGCAHPEVRARTVASEIRGPAVVRDFIALRKSSSRLSHMGLSETRLRGFSDKTIEDLYDAVGRVTFHLPDDSDSLALQARLLMEKVARGTRTERDLRDMYLAYVAARDFTAAKNLRTASPGVEFPFVPEILPPSKESANVRWRAYDILEEGEKARLLDLPLGTGSKVVVAMLTSCGVTERALQEILADAQVAESFRASGFLLTTRFDAKGVAKWRGHFGFEKVYVAAKAADFPGIDFRSSPHFYFLKDGKVVSHFEGWGKGDGYDTMAQLRDGLKTIAP